MKTTFLKTIILSHLILLAIGNVTAQIGNLSILYTSENSVAFAGEIKTFDKQSVVIQTNSWIRNTELPQRGEYFNASGFRLSGDYRFYYSEEGKKLSGAYAEIGGVIGWHQVDFRKIEGGPTLIDAVQTVFWLFGGVGRFPESEPSITTQISEEIFVTGLHLGTGYRFVVANRLTLDMSAHIERVVTENLRAHHEELPSNLNGFNAYLKVGIGVLF